MSGRSTLLLACLLAGFLVWQAPARLLGVLLPDRLILSAVSGSVWRGTAARSVWQLDNGALILGRVNWRLSPLSLVLLQPTVTINMEWGGQRLVGAFTQNLSGATEIKDFQAEFDTGLIRQFLPLYIGGRIIADFSKISLASNQLQSLDGTLTWQSAVWTAAAGDMSLGDYLLELSGKNRQVQGRVTTLSGGLMVAGTVAVAENNYEIDLDLSGPVTANPDLADALQLLATPSATGFDMVMKGRL